MPWAEIDNGCDYEISLDGMTKVSGSCDGPGGVSHGQSPDAQMSAQHNTAADASPFEHFALAVMGEAYWEDLEGFDSKSTGPAEVRLIATAEYYQATKMIASPSDIGAALLDDKYFAVNGIECGVFTMLGQPAPDSAAAFKIDSVEARCFDSFSRRTFFEVHGSFESDCEVTLGHAEGSMSAMGTVKVTF